MTVQASLCLSLEFLSFAKTTLWNHGTDDVINAIEIQINKMGIMGIYACQHNWEKRSGFVTACTILRSPLFMALTVGREQFVQSLYRWTTLRCILFEDQLMITLKSHF